MSVSVPQFILHGLPDKDPIKIRLPPPYFFRIDEIVESGVSAPLSDALGYWRPSTRPGDNVSIREGATGKWWHCDGQRLLHRSQPLPGSTPYATFSMFYCSGFGFWVMRGDATMPSPATTWQPLRFDYEDHNYSSYVTNAGQRTTLRTTRPDQRWPGMLFPDIYHNNTAVTPNLLRGSLKGDLAIFLALMAFSMAQNQLTGTLPMMFQNGVWLDHDLPHGRLDKRGVVVYVYTAPNSQANELLLYENGGYTCYYN